MRLLQLWQTQGKTMNREDLKCVISFRLFTDKKAFGPGIARLMELTEEYHSLNKAAAAMGMAYSKAWKILNESEQALGFSLLARHAGGRSGGGAVLTPEGRQMLTCYQSFVKEAGEAVEALFEKHFRQP